MDKQGNQIGLEIIGCLGRRGGSGNGVFFKKETK